MTTDIISAREAIRRNTTPPPSNTDLNVSRLPYGPLGFNALKTISGYIFEEAKRELRFPEACSTYEKMANDSTIKAALNVIDILINKVEWEFVGKKDNEESQAAASFLNFCKASMEDMSWEDFINDVGSYRMYGYHVAEKVFSVVKSGKWKGKIKWKNLPARSQGSISKWGFDNKNTLIGVYQQPSYVGYTEQFGEVFIPKNKLLHFVYDKKRGNPEGNSPLKGCYTAWKYKLVVEEYEAVGVAKDLGGIPVIGVPVEYLNKASENPGGSEAAVISQMQRDAANLHAGKQSYVMRPIAYDDRGNELFKFGLEGVSGGGKQYNTDDIIRRKQNEMLTLFLADVLKLGQDGSGSFALSDSKNNLLTLAIESHLKLIQATINRQLIPQTLAVNGWRFESEDMPYIRFGDIDETNLEELGKFIQRVVSVGAITPDKALENSLREAAGVPTNNYNEPIPDEFKADSKSRAGDGMKTSGDGTSTSPGGGDKNTSSTES